MIPVWNIYLFSFSGVPACHRKDICSLPLYAQDSDLNLTGYLNTFDRCWYDCLSDLILRFWRGGDCRVQEERLGSGGQQLLDRGHPRGEHQGGVELDLPQQGLRHGPQEVPVLQAPGDRHLQRHGPPPRPPWHWQNLFLQCPRQQGHHQLHHADHHGDGDQFYAGCNPADRRAWDFHCI